MHNKSEKFPYSDICIFWKFHVSNILLSEKMFCCQICKKLFRTNKAYNDQRIHRFLLNVNFKCVVPKNKENTTNFRTLKKNDGHKNS